MAFPTITAGGSQSWSSQSSVTFSSVTGLDVDKLLLIAVYNQVVSGTPNKPTVTGTGFTFTEVTSQINGIGRLTIFRALNKGTSPTSVNPTIDFAGQTQDVTKFSSSIITGAHLSGENASSPYDRLRAPQALARPPRAPSRYRTRFAISMV